MQENPNWPLDQSSLPWVQRKLIQQNEEDWVISGRCRRRQIAVGSQLVVRGLGALLAIELTLVVSSLFTGEPQT